METLLYNPFVNGKPFMIKQEDGSFKLYSRDEIIALGKKYDKACDIAILEYKQIVVIED